MEECTLDASLLFRNLSFREYTVCDLFNFSFSLDVNLCMSDQSVVSGGNFGEWALDCCGVNCPKSSSQRTTLILVCLHKKKKRCKRIKEATTDLSEANFYRRNH